MDLGQLSHRNHTNDQCNECTEPEMFSWCYESFARHLGFSGDSGYFSQLCIRLEIPTLQLIILWGLLETMINT